MYGNKYKDQCSLDLNQVCEVVPQPHIKLHEHIAQQRAKTAKQILFATVLFGAVMLATQLLATPWTDENGNPNPDCTGSCHETGIPNPPTPEPPKQSHKPRDGKGSDDTVVQCGCGYVVHLRDGITKADALKACERKFTELQLQSCSWPNGVNPGDKG